MPALCEMARERDRIITGIEWTCQLRKIRNTDQMQILLSTEPPLIL